VTATDALGCTGSRRYTGSITGGLALRPDSLSDGTVHVGYSATITASGGTEPYAFEVFGIPPGLKPVVTSSSVTLTGEPAEGGCFTVTVKATTPAPPADPVCSIEKTYRIVIRPVPATFSPDPLPPGTLCTPYCEKISISGCTGEEYSFDDLPAGVLPPEITFDPKTGTLCGTPRKLGTYRFAIVAKDPLGNATSHPYELRILCPTTITIDPLPEAMACVRYEHQLTVAGCDYPFTFSEIPEAPLPDDLGLPDGGLLSGVPAKPDNYTFDVLVTSKDCPPIRVRNLRLKVVCATTSSPQNLPSGRIAKPYSRILSACGGTPPCSIVSGPLPPGLTLTPNCTLSGVPTTPGCFTFSVRASGGCEQSYVLCILPVGTGTPVLGGWGMGVLCAFLIFVALLSLRRHGV